MKKALAITTLVFTFLLQACSEEQSSTNSSNSGSGSISYADKPLDSHKISYVLGVHPLHSPSKLVLTYGPLADYLSSKLDNAHITVEASKDYARFEEKLKAQHFDFILPNPYQTLIAQNYGYEVINQVGRQEIFKGILLVRKDSKITKLADLKGKTISYPAPTALAGAMMPQYFLKHQGLDLNLLEHHYVGTQESSIMHVYYNKSNVAATWFVPWFDLQKNNPQIAKELKVAWQTKTLPSNSFMFEKQKVDIGVAYKVKSLLANLHTHEEGKTILATMNVKQILTASNETYEPVARFMQNFNKEIGDNTQFPKVRIGVKGVR